MATVEYSGLILLTDSQHEPTLADRCYDLAIIGAGISSAYTLINYISLLERQPAIADRTPALVSDLGDRDARPVRIVVTEKSGDFWTGIPYGKRSGRNSLLISPLKEFIPQQLEREHFIDWLTKNRARIFDPQEYNKGEMSAKWLRDNADAIDRDRWDELFIPRHTFGLYLQERMTNLLATATAKGLIEIDLLTADAIDVQQIADGYRVDFVATETNNYFVTNKLVLAIGSPPNVAFERVSSDGQKSDPCYIDNMYEPSLDENIDRLCQSLAQLESPSQRQVLIVGSNAGTLDVLYSINNSKAATSLIEKFLILSPNATFPHRIDTAPIQLDYTPQHLVALLQSDSFTAKQILEAVKQDVTHATSVGINISDIYTDISKLVMAALNRLNFGEQCQFVSKYAVEIGKFQRRAGGEYLDVVERAIAAGKLELLKGKFVRYLPLTTGGCNCEYLDPEDRQQKVLDTPIGVVINCGGFQDVTTSSSPLIQNLIRRQICVPNESNRGFVIDKNFEASKNCYLMGPLVAGNIDGNFRVWHAESCQRIIGFSQNLAAALLRSEQLNAPSVTLAPEPESANVLVNIA
jgi:uncharacterized NAD(P)/FAD-binding protein YdhS